MRSLVQRRPYDTDMSDAEWEIYQKVFPELTGIPGVSEPKTTTRELLNAIRYQERTGCQWRNLPHDLPPSSTVKSHYYEWLYKGLFEKFRQYVVKEVRTQEGRPNPPTACAIDSQSVKTTEMGGPKGNDNGKKTKGRKRHILVDVLGLVLAVLITGADVQDRDGGAAVLRQAKVEYPTIKMAAVDNAYNGIFEDVCRDLEVKIEKKSKPEGTPGFVPIRIRWVVERTFGWINWYRRLSKDSERTIESSQARFDIAIGMTLTARLCGKKIRFRH